MALLNKAVENWVVNGIMSCQNGVCISHLLFTDDSLLFCKATVGECQQLLSILGQYEAALRQAINRQKTSLFFSKNTNPEIRRLIQQQMRARVMTNSDKYLGLPMTCGKSRVNTFKELEEKILKRVLWWKEKFISKAGREVLIKTVAQASPHMP